MSSENVLLLMRNGYEQHVISKLKQIDLSLKLHAEEFKYARFKFLRRRSAC